MSASISILVKFGGTDGTDPYGGLAADANGDLFGTTVYGGPGGIPGYASGNGTVFEIPYSAANGYATTPTVLANFDGADGSAPLGSLHLDAQGNLFGTTHYGGANGSGEVFEITYNPQTGYATTPTVLASFGSGASLRSGLIEDANGDLFGVTGGGGTYGGGTVFEIVNTTTGYASTPATLTDFSDADGEVPIGALIADSAGALFGTTDQGGANGYGTVFEIAKTATGYANTPTVLVNLDDTTWGSFSGLTADANGDLFGASGDGGAYAGGAIYEIAKTATGYASTPTVLASFDGPVAHSGPELNTDGSYPTGNLIIDAVGDLFGTTEYGGATGDGTAFEIAKTATGYASTPTVLHSFSNSDGDGAIPASGLIADAVGNLLGTTEEGGAGEAGTVFEITGSGFVQAGIGPEEFSQQQTAATGPLTGDYLWSDATNWTDGVPFDNDSAISHSEGVDDVAALSLFELDLLAGGTVIAVQNLAIDTLIADATTTVFANTTLPGSAASVTVSIGAFTATAGSYGAAGAGAVLDDTAATSPGAALYIASYGGKIAVANDLTIGDATAGALEVTTGGQVTSVNGIIDLGSVTVDGTGSSWNMSGALTIGVQDGTASPSLTISDNASVTTSTDVSNDDQLLDGSLTLETGGRLTEIQLSLNNIATLTVESGAVLNETVPSPHPRYVGLLADGEVFLNGGTLSSANEYTEIGGIRGSEAGVGTVTVSKGAVATNLTTYIGYESGDIGSLTVSGAGTTWTDVYDSPLDMNNAGINVGVEGKGNLTVMAGATLTNPLSYIKVAQFLYSTGTILVTGSGSTLSAGGLLRVGDSGTGTMIVENDSTVSVGQVQVGDYYLSDGTLKIHSGATLSTDSASMVDVGEQKIADPGMIDVAAGSFDIAVQSGSFGNVDVDGGTLIVQGDITDGDSGEATLSVEDGGMIFATDVSVGSPTTGAGLFYLKAGGTLVAASFVAVRGRSGVFMEGGVLDPPQITIDAGGTLTGYGAVEGSVDNSGSITASGGTLDITGDVNGGGMLMLMPDATLQLEGNVTDTAGITFTGTGETLVLGAHADVNSTIIGLTAGDSIGVEGGGVTSVEYDPDSKQLAVTGSDGSVFDFTLSGAYQQRDFSVADGEVTVPCFLRGTRIATACGEIEVEKLAIGDMVHTRFSGLGRVKWIGHRRIDCERHRDPRKVWPVRVRAGACGDGLPWRDLWLSPDHSLFFDGALIPVQHLVDGGDIAQVQADEVVYYHVELERHDVLLAEGMPAESYLDTDNRGMFANADDPIRLHPDLRSLRWEACGCAPLVVTGPKLAAVRARCASRNDRVRQAAEPGEVAIAAASRQHRRAVGRLSRNAGVGFSSSGWDGRLAALPWPGGGYTSRT